MEENKNVVNTSTTEKEGSKFGWGVLGFFFPLVGLILFLVWMKDKKKASKAAGIGALIGFLVNVLLTTLSLMGVISIFTLSGEPVIDVKTNTKTVEKKKADTKKETTNKEETKTEEKKTDSKTESTTNPCDVKVKAKNDTTYTYEVSSCDTTNILDGSNNILFKYTNDKIITNNGVELDNPTKEFWKLNNSLVLYSKMCSPGYCYVYVYNTNDNTGFKVDTSLASDIIFPLTIKGIDTDINNKLQVKMKLNESASMESISNDPKYQVYKNVKSCEIKDIDAALDLYHVDDFPVERTYVFSNVNGSLTDSDPYISTVTIKDLYKITCKR